MIKVFQIAQYALLFTVVLALASCGVPKSEHKLLEEKYTKVQQEISELNEQAKNIQLENAFLKKQVKELEEQIKKLNEANEDLKERYQHPVAQEETATTTQ